MKHKPHSAIRVRAYEVIRRAVEEGVVYGWTRAHKHTDTPTGETIMDAIESAVMTALCEVVDFGDEQ